MQIKFMKACWEAPPYKTEEVKSEGVRTSFFKMGESKVELLEASNPESAISKFIDKRGEGMHHIAFLVDDIESEILRLKKRVLLCWTKPKKRSR